MSDENTPLKAYNVTVRFDDPMGGVVTVAASSPEEAKKKLLAMFQNHRNVEITDVYDLDDAPVIREAMEKQQSPTAVEPVNKKLN